MPAELVHAILPPPDLWKFRELTGVGDAELDVSFDGWSKLAILSADKVFLFPRRGHDEELLHGALASDSLAGLGLGCVPRVLGRWPDGVLDAGPFIAYERRAGTKWPELERTVGLADLARMLTSVGGLIATWHALGVSRLPVALRRPLAQDRHWLARFLDTDRVEVRSTRLSGCWTPSPLGQDSGGGPRTG